MVQGVKIRWWYNEPTGTYVAAIIGWTFLPDHGEELKQWIINNTSGSYIQSGWTEFPDLENLTLFLLAWE
jgi:hypothetical protein